MISNSTIRQVGGSVYLKIPPQYVEYFELKEHIARSKQNGSIADCKVEDKGQNRLIVMFPKW